MIATSRGDLGRAPHLRASEAWTEGRRHAWGGGEGVAVRVYIFHTANATKMAAASLFP